MLGARVVAASARSNGCVDRGGRRTEDVFGDPFMWWVFLLLLPLGWRECERECECERRVGVTVKSEAKDVEDGEDVSLESAWVVRACGRGVRGTAVDRDEVDVEDDVEGAGETERDDTEVCVSDGGV